MRLIPCTFARSSIDACRIPWRPPNCFSRSVRRFGPSPGISSSGDSAPRAVPRPSMPGDREAMRFIANALNQTQRRRVRRKYKRRFLTGQEKAFLSCPAIGAFRDSHDHESLHAERIECRERRVELPRAAVDQQQIGHWRFAAQDACEAPLHRLTESTIIVAWCELAQVEPTVVALDWPLDTEHYARCHRRLPHRVAHVKALDPCRRAPELQLACQSVELLGHRRAARGAHAEAQFRVRTRHREPARARAADVPADANGMPAPFAERGFEHVAILQWQVDEDFGGGAAREIVLSEKSRQRLLRAAEPAPWKIVAAAEVTAAAHVHHGDAVFAALPRDGDGVDILRRGPRDGLAGLDVLEHRDLVAQTCRVLELERLRRGFHAPAEVGDHLGVAAVEHANRIGDVLRVLLGRSPGGRTVPGNARSGIAGTDATGSRRTCPRTGARETASAAAAAFHASRTLLGYGPKYLFGPLRGPR